MNQDRYVDKKLHRTVLLWANIIVVAPLLFIGVLAAFQTRLDAPLSFLFILMADFPIAFLLIPAALFVAVIDCAFLLAVRRPPVQKQKNSTRSLVRLAVLTFSIGISIILLMTLAWGYLQFMDY